MNLFLSKQSQKVLAVVLSVSLILHLAVMLALGAFKFVVKLVDGESVFDVAPVDTPPQIKPEYVVNIELERPTEPDLRRLTILPDSSVAIDIPTLGIDVEFKKQSTGKSTTQTAE